MLNTTTLLLQVQEWSVTSGDVSCPLPPLPPSWYSPRTRDQASPSSRAISSTSPTYRGWCCSVRRRSVSWRRRSRGPVTCSPLLSRGGDGPPGRRQRSVRARAETVITLLAGHLFLVIRSSCGVLIGYIVCNTWFIIGWSWTMVIDIPCPDRLSLCRKCLAPSHLPDIMKAFSCPGSPEKRVSCQLDTCDKTGSQFSLEHSFGIVF